MGLIATIARRFLRGRSSTVSVIAVIAVLGSGLGVAILDVTLAIMNGFRDEIQLTFVENMPMVTVLNTRPRGFSDLDELIPKLEGHEDVLAAAPFVRKEGVLTSERIPGRPQHAGAVVWGIDAHRQMSVTPLDKHIEPPFDGFETGSDLPGVVLGSELANRLRAVPGNVVVLTAPQSKSRLGGEIVSETREFEVVGLLESGMFEFDNSFCYIDREEARDLYKLLGEADGVGLRIGPMMQAPQLARELEEWLGSPPYFCNDWISLNSQLFEWIRMEKILMFLLLLFISLVASFLLVAILLFLVSERQKEIGILMALGLPRRSIWHLFNMLGLGLASVGILAGTILGVAISWGLDRFGLRLPGGIYFVDELPVHLKAGDILMVAGATLLIAFIATGLTSMVATRYTPVEVLRHG